MAQPDFHTILVGVDDSADAQAAFRYAMHRAKADAAHLIIASVLESPDMNVYQALNADYVHGARQTLVQHLAGYQRLAERNGIAHVRVVIGEGDAGETIVHQLIPQVQPDLLVVGAAAKTGLAKHFGSQAAYMAKYAPCSVLVIRM